MTQVPDPRLCSVGDMNSTMPTVPQRSGVLFHPLNREEPKMSNGPVSFEDILAIGHQPSADDLHRIAEQGFRSVLNVRTHNEENLTLKPEQEDEITRQLGLNYVSLPISVRTLDEETLEDFEAYMDEIPKPVFVHSTMGTRAAILAAIYLARQNGWSGQETIDFLRERGFDCKIPQLETFIRANVRPQ